MRLRPYREIPEQEWIVPSKSRLSLDKKRERIRQWLLAELTDTYFYPREWLEKRTVFSESQGPEPGIPKRFFGFCLVTAKRDPFLWASVEIAGRSDESESRLRELLRESATCRFGISSDGTDKSRCFRQRSNSDECDIVTDIEAFKDSRTGLALAMPYSAPGRERNGAQLEPISSTLEDVFFEAHSHIRDIDGLHADEALDELCKVLYTKLFDEEVTPPGEPYALQRELTATTEELAASVRRKYMDAGENDARSHSPKVRGRRGPFNAPLRLSSPALVRVVEAIAPYSLTRSGVDVKGRAFQRVLSASMRAGMGQYFTPSEVISFMVEVMNPTVNESVLDPFAGSGHFLARVFESFGGSSKSARPLAKLQGIEKSDRMVRVATTDMRLQGDAHSAFMCTDSLLDFANYPELRPESFDVVLTNPPFGSLLGPEAVASLAQFELSKGRRSVPLEILGLERCLDFLKPGGRLAIVIPDGVLANRATSHVRDLVSQRAKVRIIASLPDETFAPFGANIKTSVLFLRKWKSGEKRTADHYVHLLKIENVGYDASGRGRQDSDLRRAVESAKQFLDREGW